MNNNELFIEIAHSFLEVAQAEYAHLKNPQLNSIEFLKFSFAQHFQEDVNFLIQLDGNSLFHPRYANIIIRDILEQTIELLYIIKNPDLIDQYLGLEINLNLINESESPLENLKQFGQNRFIEKRPRISDMAINIEEYSSTDDKLALYSIYHILSEECHNSYYTSILDEVDMASNECTILALTDEQRMYLTWITNSLIPVYSSEKDT
jgi:hypothetical protein